MKSIKSKLYIVYTMVFLALTLNVMSSYVVINTHNQHIMLTEILFSQIRYVESLTASVSSLSQIRTMDNEKFDANLAESVSELDDYKSNIDMLLTSLEIREYDYNGSIKKFNFKGEFEIAIDEAITEAQNNWLTIQTNIDELLSPETKINDSYVNKLIHFNKSKLILISDAEKIMKICRTVADTQKKNSTLLQIGTLIIGFLILLWLMNFITASIQKPIIKIRNVFKKMSQGDYEVSLNRKKNDEFSQLFDDFNKFIDNRSIILDIQDKILSEDNLRIVLTKMLTSFQSFVPLDKISIIYTDSDNTNLKIDSDSSVVVKLDLIKEYKEIICVDKFTLAMPINVNNVYLGYALFSKKTEYNNHDIKFISGLEKPIGFAFYKSLIFRDLLSIVTSGLADLTESRDPETKRHLVRMSYYSEIIAKNLFMNNKFKTEINDEFIDNIKLVAPMHDIGKVSVPDEILLKPGKLTFDEYEVMKTHAFEGGKVLSNINRRFLRYNLTYFNMASQIAHFHQEKFDGSGYPNSISGCDIPLSARICAIADVFDALTSKRPYKEAFSLEKSYKIIKDGIGNHFDPILVEAFFDSQKEVEEIYYKYREI